MTDYNVEWNFDAEDCGSRREAAQMAWDALRREGSIANAFAVSDAMDMTTVVDLHEDTESAVAWMPGPDRIADLAQWMFDHGAMASEIVEMIRRPNKYADEYSKMVIEREYDKVAKEPEEAEPTPAMTESKLRVSFRPEVWVDDHAVEVAVDWGQFEWNVSEETAELIHQAFRTGALDLDFVREDFFTPRWMVEWTGPFTIESLGESVDPDDVFV